MGYTLPKRFIPLFTPAYPSFLSFAVMFLLIPPHALYLYFSPSLFSSISVSLFFPSPTVLYPPVSLSFHSLAFESPLTLLSLCTTLLPHPPPPLFIPLFSPRLNAGHEQNPAHHGEGWHTLLQRLLHYTHVLSVPVLHPDREVCAQPSHLHQQ